MDELIGRLVADAGADLTAAHGTVGIAVQFPLEDAPFETVRTPMQQPLPGAEAASLTAGRRSSQAIIHEPLKFSREPWENGVGTLVGAIPGLGQSV